MQFSVSIYNINRISEWLCLTFALYSVCRNSNLGTTFVLRDRVPVNGMVYDPMFTIVFTLEYLITEPISKSTNKVMNVCTNEIHFGLVCTLLVLWSCALMPQWNTTLGPYIQNFTLL